MIGRTPIDPFGVADVFTDAPPVFEHRGGAVFVTFTTMRDGENLVVSRVVMTADTFARTRDAFNLRPPKETIPVMYERTGCRGSC